MNWMQRIAQKLGGYSQRKDGAEFLFGCPKCHHAKLEVNPGKRLFHCFRCAYKGTLRQLLRDLNIAPFTPIAVASMKTPVRIEAQECKIPKFTPFKANDLHGIPLQVYPFLQAKNLLVPDAVRMRMGTSEDNSLRGRLIIPIVEAGINVCYVARSVNGAQPKEMSGPNRSWFLYGIDGVKKDEPVVLVEGIFDAEAVVRAGFNGVAIMGSNISDTQIGKLLAKNPYPILLMFDGDKAGAEGTVKAYRKLLKRTHTPIRDVSLTDDIDPDEIPTDSLRELLLGAWRSI